MEFHVQIHEEDDGTYWAEVKELPGCFASGDNLEELKEALFEAIRMCLKPEDLPQPRLEQTRAGRVEEMTLLVPA